MILVLWLDVEDNLTYGDLNSRNIINATNSVLRKVQTFRSLVNQIAKSTNNNATKSIT